MTSKLPVALGSGLMLCIFFCTLPSISSAQFFNPRSYTYWLNPESNAVSKKDSIAIGNYYCLNNQDAFFKKTFHDIARYKEGTLFMVVKTLDSTSERPLAGLGRIELYRDKFVISGNESPLSHVLKSEPAILRLSYSYSSGHKYFGGIAFVDSTTRFTEILHFDRLLDTMEIRKVETYLALKYSINITENKNKKLRDYIDGKDSKYWDVERDLVFNEEVMALGRVDSLGFYQTQTFSADAASIQISLDSTSLLAQMPEGDLANNSMLIFSKSKTTPEAMQCGEALGSRAWQINPVNWKYETDRVYLTVKQQLSKDEWPSLSNGYSQIPIRGMQSGDYTRLTIPVTAEMEESQYYLVWGAPETRCKPLCQVVTTPCTPATPSFINLKLAPEALPAHVDLLNLTTNERLEETLMVENSTIKNLASGQYQIHISNPEVTLADQVILLDNCPDLTDPYAGHPWANEANLLTSGADNTNTGNGHGTSQSGTDNTSSGMYLQEQRVTAGIRAYPNPSSGDHEIHFQFNDLNDMPFKIEVFDKGGSPLLVEKFTPSGTAPLFSHIFDVDGTYLVRFTSPSYSDLIQVVVN